MAKKRRPEASPEIRQEIVALLDQASTDEDERIHILDHLARHRSADLMAVLEDYVRERGERSLPALSYLVRCGDDNVSLAAIHALGLVVSEETVQLLQHIETSSGKEARRAARRSLYRLASAGLKVEPQPQRPWLGPDVLTPYKAYATGLIDGHLRLYWVAFQRPLGGLATTFVQADYQLGPTDAFNSDMSQRAFERKIHELQGREDRYLWAELPFAYACHRLLQSGQLAVEAGKDLPASLQRVTRMLESHAQSPDGHPVYSLVSQAEVKLVPDFLAESANLLATFGEFVWGTHPPVDLDEEIQELSRAQESRVVLGPEAQQQRTEAVLARAFSRVFLGNLRAQWQLKLEDLAHNLALLGRDRFAKQALAVAVALRDVTETELRQVPLLKALIPFWLKLPRGAER